ncbi:MAG: ATP-binding domain-containing protein, partial [Halorhodospira sp.]
TLQVSRRFRPDSGIGRLAAAINAGDREGALAVVRGESGSGRGDAGSSAGNGDGGASGGAAVEADRGPAGEGEPEVIGELDGPRPAERAARALVAAYRPLAEAQEPAEALQILERVRLLTATRVGPCGSIALNQAIEAQLAEEAGRDPQRRWYHGRPVLVLSNDYRAGLLNGDLGVCLADPQGRLRVWIPSTEGLRSFLPASLPEHQPAYAMTVHKSQGSEVDHAHILLPERDMPLITRELLYTAVTRARQRVTLYGPASVIAQGVARPTERMSSLAERLRGAG